MVGRVFGYSLGGSLFAASVIVAHSRVVVYPRCVEHQVKSSQSLRIVSMMVLCVTTSSRAAESK